MNTQEYLIEAGKLATAAGKAKETAQNKSAAAIDYAIAGFMAAGVLATTLEYDVRDQAGNIIETAKSTIADYVAGRGFKTEAGKAFRAKESAYRNAMLAHFFQVKGDQSAGAKAVWTMATRAAKSAVVLVAQGITAHIENKKLRVEGGKGPHAEAIKTAAEKSTKALNQAADKAAGRNKAAQKKKDGAIEASDLDTALRIVAIYAKAITEGNAAPSETRLSFLRAILSAAPTIRDHDTK
jgi:hypothetical protein